MKKIFMILLITMLFSSAVSAADEERLLTVVHSGEYNYFRLAAEPGEVVNVPYRLENRSECDITNHILIYDSVSAVNGGTEVMAPDAIKNEETGGWFSENSEIVTVGAGKKKEHSFRFAVPEDCEDGLYTAIFAVYSEADIEKIEQDNEDVSLNINNFHTSTLAIVIEVGEKPEKVIGFGKDARLEVGPDGMGYLYIPVKNSGNTYEFPVVAVKVEKAGKTIFSGEKSMDIVYGNTDTYACFETGDGMLEEGEYIAGAVMKDKDTGKPLAAKDYDLTIGKHISKKATEFEAMNEVVESGGGSFMLFNKKQMAWISLITVAGIILVALAAVKFGEKKARKTSKP